MSFKKTNSKYTYSELDKVYTSVTMRNSALGRASINESPSSNRKHKSINNTDYPFTNSLLNPKTTKKNTPRSSNKSELIDSTENRKSKAVFFTDIFGNNLVALTQPDLNTIYIYSTPNHKEMCKLIGTDSSEAGEIKLFFGCGYEEISVVTLNLELPLKHIFLVGNGDYIISSRNDKHASKKPDMIYSGINRCDYVNQELLDPRILPLLISSILSEAFYKKDEENNKNFINGYNSTKKTIDISESNHFGDSEKERFYNDLRIDEIEKRIFPNNQEPAKNLKVFSNNSLIQQTATSLEIIEHVSRAAYLQKKVSTSAGLACYNFRTISLKPNGVFKIPNPSLTIKTKHQKNMEPLKINDIDNDLLLLGAFANGVSSGLSIKKNSIEMLTPSWILLKAPKNISVISPELSVGDRVYTEANEFYNISIASHSGLILGLGLSSLKKSPLGQMSCWRMIPYFNLKMEILTCALLLGRSCCYLGTGYRDTSTNELLLLHIPWFNNNSTISGIGSTFDNNFLGTTQIIAVLGLGLVYRGTLDKRVASFLINQIATSETGHDSNFLEKLVTNTEIECYQQYILTCGMSLGLICLGKGDIFSSSFLDNEKNLFESISSVLETKKQKNKSTGMRSMYQTSVVIALTLGYINTQNTKVALKLNYQSDSNHYMSSDPGFLLLLKTTGYWLILTESLEPNINFIFKQALPNNIIHQLFYQADINTLLSNNNSHIPEIPKMKSVCNNLTKEVRSYIQIISGVLFAISLKYAGTHNLEAKNTVLAVLDSFIVKLQDENIGDTDKISQNQNKTDGIYFLYLFGSCFLAACVSLIVSGSGDLEVLKRLRFLDQKVIDILVRKHIYSVYESENIFNSETMLNTTLPSFYGYLEYIKFGLGMTFLGKGKNKLSCTKESISAIYISIFPMLTRCESRKTGKIHEFFGKNQNFHDRNSRFSLFMRRFLWALAVEGDTVSDKTTLDKKFKKNETTKKSNANLYSTSSLGKELDSAFKVYEHWLKTKKLALNLRKDNNELYNKTLDKDLYDFENMASTFTTTKMALPLSKFNFFNGFEPNVITPSTPILKIHSKAEPTSIKTLDGPQHNYTDYGIQLANFYYNLINTQICYAPHNS
ncbi:hypothetical protein BB559_002372 [Furculomyces boomerangus]|uniref:Uncharacterized protein n=2 Tax=Harpellales TaxID=61421 RepID=A0A2T9YVZ5_9FUNG|nr:hypothetical protein BB559_002372 [Furculomyces boomerangus]PWA00445.1 hypothetical protein BB558_003483 [Smittium angustum]